MADLVRSSGSRVQRVPARVGVEEQRLEFFEPAKGAVNLRGGTLVEVGRHHGRPQLALLVFESLDPGRELLELELLLVRRLATDALPVDRRRCIGSRGGGRARGYRLRTATLPQPVFVPADVFLHAAFSFEGE